MCCNKCDSKILATTKQLAWFECGRVVTNENEIVFSCDEKKWKTRCRADGGKMISFADFLKKTLPV